MILHVELALTEREEAELEQAWWSSRDDADISATVLALLATRQDALLDAVADLEHDQGWQPPRCPRCGEEVSNRYASDVLDDAVWHIGCATDEGRDRVKGLTEEVWG